MSIIAFFPWLRLSEQTNFGGYQIIDLPTDDPAYNAHIAQYRIRNFGPEKSFSLPKYSSLLKKESGDISEEDIESIFETVNMLSFAGISNREYFNLCNYYNYDHFKFILQRSSDKSGFVSIQSRRRDGYTWHSVDINTILEICPLNVNNSQKVSFDKDILIGLNKIKTSLPQSWHLFTESIEYFLQANKDSNDISGHQECILLVSAFERIFNCGRGKEDDVLAAIMPFFKKYSSKTKKDSIRFSKIHKYNPDISLIELWIRDLFQMRSEYAHGNLSSKRPQFWSLHEHLLLSSYLFPVLVKHIMNSYGFCPIRDEDEYKLYVYQHLLDADLFLKPDDQESSCDFNWTRIWSKKRFDMATIKLSQMLQAT